MNQKKFKIVILGSGAGGLSVAAKLAKKISPFSMAIIDPSEKHYYQPMWTLAGAGLVKKSTTEKNQKSLIPINTNWIKESVLKIDPKNQNIFLTNNLQIEYEFLIVATGLKLNWNKIEGLENYLGKNGIGSIYDFDSLEYTADLINKFKGGTALFVMPPAPIKCAGAPQKIMYLAEHIFRNNGIRQKTEILFATSGKAMFGVPVFAEALQKQVENKGIKPLFLHKIIGVSPVEKEAIFEVTSLDGQLKRKKIKFDFLHLVPTMSAHSYVADSGLAYTEGEHKGWLAVDKFTLQHIKYSNIFGLGDVTGIPNSKTAAAIRKQVPIVVKNLLSVIEGQSALEKYDGYSSCPLITEIGKVMLAEFGYDNKLMPTFPLDPAIPRKSYWYLKKDLIPFMYWHGMLKGRA